MPGDSLKIPVEVAKKRVLDDIAKGAKVEEAMRRVGRMLRTYETWRAEDPSFKKKIDEIRAHQRRQKNSTTPVRPGSGTHMAFADWRKLYLGRETYLHQRQWIDIIEGRVPEGLHPSMMYEPADPRRILINTPPFHAKSTIITCEYVVYRICMNPNIRVVIVSKTQTMAKKFLYSIKKMLTDPQYADLQRAYGPLEGYKSKEEPWTADMIYLPERDGSEKDPSVQALGIGGHIYGARSDLIILDDCVTKANVAEFEKQFEWLTQEVASRTKTGRIIVVGTRVGTTDLYSELRSEHNYTGKSPWTSLRQPAVLEFADDQKDWKTLWPYSTEPLDADSVEADEEAVDGLYPAWDGPSLARVRGSVRPGTWSMVYQQQDVSDDATFDPVAVLGSCNRRRKAGPLKAGGWGHPRKGSEGMYIIASMDPAMSNDTFTLVMAVDRASKMRYVENCWIKTAPTPAYIRDLIKQVTVDYGVNEWVIEQNAFQKFLVYDEDIQDYCRNRGVRITPHFTSRNKLDPEFGVASVAPLFGTTHRINEGAGRKVHSGDNMIELPDPDSSEGVKALIDQLVSWIPGKLGKQLKMDGPMALWFAELRARNVILPNATQERTFFIKNPYLTRRERQSRTVIPAAVYQRTVSGADE